VTAERWLVSGYHEGLSPLRRIIRLHLAAGKSRPEVAAGPTQSRTAIGHLETARNLPSAPARTDNPVRLWVVLCSTSPCSAGCGEPRWSRSFQDRV
jgi:hypothetical protein